MCPCDSRISDSSRHNWAITSQPSSIFCVPLRFSAARIRYYCGVSPYTQFVSRLSTRSPRRHAVFVAVLCSRCPTYSFWHYLVSSSWCLCLYLASRCATCSPHHYPASKRWWPARCLPLSGSLYPGIQRSSLRVCSEWRLLSRFEIMIWLSW